MSRAARLAALAASAADPVAAFADEWYFLREWFDLLGAMGASCDHRDKVDGVRVGREASDAGGAWLELSFGRDELDPNDDSENSDDSDDGFLGSVQEWLKKPVVRERLRQTSAILLTNVVAQVDFNSWLRIMSEQLYLELPAHWTVPDESGRQPHILLQYKLLFDTQNDTEFLDWNETLRHLLGMLKGDRVSGWDRLHERRGCPHCEHAEDGGSLPHIFWTCPAAQALWQVLLDGWSRFDIWDEKRDVRGLLKDAAFNLRLPRFPMGPGNCTN